MTSILSIDYFNSQDGTEASLRASNIPVHYAISSNQKFYDLNFIKKVKNETSQTIVKYLKSKNKFAHIEFDINKPEKIYNKRTKLTTDLLKLVFTDISGIEVHMREHRMTLKPDETHKFLIKYLVSKDEHFTSILKEYSIPGCEKTYCWKIKSFETKDKDALNVYMRAFAITHNNLALKDLKLVN